MYIKDRNEYLDWLKGFAIILVVLGHCWLLDNGLFWFIYRFHMPLFFCISGYLFNGKRKYKNFLKNKIKTVMVPYIIFFIVSYLITTFLFNEDINLLYGLKYMLLNGRYCSIVSNWAIWYLPLFFIASNIFYFFLKIKNNIIKYIIVIILFFATVPLNTYFYEVFTDSFIPFTLQALSPALFFMSLGYFAKKTKIKIKNKKFIKLIPVASTLLFILGISLSIYNYDQILRVTTYKYIIASLLIIQFIIIITKNNNNKIISYIGKNSLVILGYHRVLLACLEYYNLGTFLEQYNISGNFGAILITIICIVIICILNEFKNIIFKECTKLYILLKNRINYNSMV